MERRHRESTGNDRPFAELGYECNRLVMRQLFAGEVEHAAIGGKASPQQALRAAASDLQDRAQRASNLQLAIAPGSAVLYNCVLSW